MRPMVPMEIRSSTPTPVLSNFFAMYTTSRRLCSMSSFLAALSSSVPSLPMASASSSASRGAGRMSEPPI